MKYIFGTSETLKLYALQGRQRSEIDGDRLILRGAKYGEMT